MRRFFIPIILLFSSLPGLMADPVSAPKLPDHPRLLIRKETLVEIRQRAEKTDWGKKALAGIQHSADGWLKKEIQLPDRGSQWWHWYACKKDGANLKTESPTRHVCPVCGEVYSGYPYDDVLLSRIHDGLARGLLDCGLIYQLSGDKRYAGKGKEILLAYAQKYRSYKLHTIRGEEKVGGGRVGPQTLDESTWLIVMAQGADLIWETLTAEERKQAADGLFYPAAVEVIQKHKMGVHNIQCWKNSAVGLTGFLLGDAALIADAIDNPDRGYRTQMAKGVSPDGCWYEGAWGYHFYTMGALWPLAEAAHNCGINLYGPEYKRLFEGPMMLAMPNWHLPAFNDSGEADVLGTASLYELALTRYNDPAFAAVVAKSNRGSLQSLIAGKLELPPVPAAARGSRNFPGSGYAILSGGEGEQATWLALKYGPHGGGHGHPDKLNFVLCSHGKVIAPDPGTAHYGVPIQKEWFRTTVGHNTLVVDEQSQKESTGQCLAFVAGPRLGAVAAEAGPVYPGVKFQRTVALFGDDVLLFVDRISSTTNHTFDLFYHDSSDGSVPVKGQEWTPSQQPGYMHLKGAIASTGAGLFGTEFAHKGDVSTKFLAVLPESWQAIVGSGIGHNTKERLGMVLLRGKGCEAVVGWGLILAKPGSTVEPKLTLSPTAGFEKAATLQLILGDRVCTLVSNPSGQSVPIPGGKPNALLTCMEQIGGKQTVEQAGK